MEPLKAAGDWVVPNDRQSFLGFFNSKTGQAAVLKKRSHLGLTDADWQTVRKE